MNPNNTIQKQISTFGGWNPDATEASMNDGDLLECVNMRKAKPDEYETRSGIKIMGNYAGAGFIPRASCEYRLDDLYVNVVFYEDSGNLNARIFNPELAAPVDVLISGIATGGSNYECMACQYNTYLVVTIFGFGIYALFPTLANLTTWGAPIQLGKELTPTPTFYDCAENVSGDLIVYGYETPIPNNGTDFKPLYGQSQAEPIKTRLPIGAPYFKVSKQGLTVSSSGANLRSTNLLKQFEWAKPQPGEVVSTGTLDTDKALDQNRPMGDWDHLQKRGWFYRFIMRSKYTDVKGQEFTFFHEPSVDIFVPDNDYAPPFLCIDVGGAISLIDNMINGDVINVGSNLWFWSKHLRNDANSLAVLPSLGPSNPYTDGDFAQLVAAFRNYFHDGNDIDAERDPANSPTKSNTAAESDPYYFVARVLGYYFNNFHAYLYGYPYKIGVPISELLGSPNVTFFWSSFGTLPSDVYAIDVYRTAHVDSPDFDAQTYGKAGTITPDGKFFDHINDTDLDFDGEIQRESGYLQGEMSGKVIRVWDNNLRVGDTQTKYQIHKPSDLCQAFAFDYLNASGVSSGLIPKSNLVTLDGDGLAKFTYGYQYADDDGNVSDIRELNTSLIGMNGTTDISATSLPANVGVGFTFPHGYGSKVTQIFIFEGRYNADVSNPGRVYRRIGVIQCSDGHFLWQGFASEAAWAAAPSAASSAPKVSHDPGACIWNSNQDMFFWPQLNFELENQYSPVTKIGVAVGPAHICTDQTVVKTDFGNDNRWEEVSTGPDSVGCIGRFCSIELGKAIIFLSAKGLYLAEGDGTRPFPGSVQTIVLKYLKEEIANQPRLANARRASMGWLGQRNELWLSFPASTDLGGTLEQLTIIYRFFEDFGEFSRKDVVNYRFQVTDDGNDPTKQIFYIGSAIGRLFAAFNDGSGLKIIDCDSTSADWQIPAYLTTPLAFRSPALIKKLTAAQLIADVQSELYMASGMRRTDGLYSLSQGYLHASAVTVQQNIDATEKFLQPFDHTIGSDIYNHTDRVPLLRIITKKTGSTHQARIKSLEVEFFTPEEKSMNQTFYNMRYYGSLTQDAAQHS